MQVVSGAIGREKVRFEAPPADRIESEAGASRLVAARRQASFADLDDLARRAALDRDFG
jgi:hypothetical protein